MPRYINHVPKLNTSTPIYEEGLVDLEQPQYTPPSKSTASPWAKGVARGEANEKAGWANAQALFFSALGNEGKAKEYEREAARSLREAQKYASSTPRYEDALENGSWGEYLVGGAAESLPFLLSSMQGGGVGALTAKALVKGATKKALQRGATAGVYGSIATPEAGFTYGDILDKTGERDPVRGLIGGAAKGALDTYGFTKGITNIIGKGGIRDVLTVGAREGITETGQTAIDIGLVRDALGEEVFNSLSEQEKSDLINSGILGATAGMGTAAVGKGGRRGIDAVLGENPQETIIEKYHQFKQKLSEVGTPQNERPFAENIQYSKIGDSIPDDYLDKSSPYESGQDGAANYEEATDYTDDDVIDDSFELDGVTSFEDTDIVLNNKQMPWVSNSLYEETGIKVKENAIHRQLNALNKKFRAGDAAFQIAKAELENNGNPTPENILALEEEYSPYEMRPFIEMAKRMAQQEGIPEQQAQYNVARQIAENNPRFQEIFNSEGGVKKIVDNLWYIQKAPQFKDPERYAFTDDMIFGPIRDKQDKKITPDERQKKAIIRKPAKTKKGVSYLRAGEVKAKYTNDKGNVTNAVIHLPTIIKYAQRNIKRKAGQSLLDYVSESLYSGLAELAMSSYAVDVTAIGNKNTDQNMASQFEDAVFPMTKEEKDNTVVYTEFRKDKTPVQVTLSELEATGTQRVKNKVSGIQARGERVAARLRKLRTEMQNIAEQVAMEGLSGRAKRLKAQWMKLRDTHRQLERDYKAGLREYKLAKTAEREAARKDAQNKDWELSTDSAEWVQEADGQDSGNIAGVPKTPVDRVPNKYETESEKLFNFNEVEERFEKHISRGNFGKAVEDLLTTISTLKDYRKAVLAEDPIVKRKVFLLAFAKDSNQKVPKKIFSGALIQYLDKQLNSYNALLDNELGRDHGRHVRQNKRLQKLFLDKKADLKESVLLVRELQASVSDEYIQKLRGMDVAQLEAELKSNKDKTKHTAITDMILLHEYAEERKIKFADFYKDVEEFSPKVAYPSISADKQQELSKEVMRSHNTGGMYEDMLKQDSAMVEAMNDINDDLTSGALLHSWEWKLRIEMFMQKSNLVEKNARIKQRAYDQIKALGMEGETYVLDLSELMDVVGPQVDIELLSEVMALQTNGFAFPLRKNYSDPFFVNLLDRGYEYAIFVAPFNKNKGALRRTLYHEIGHTVLFKYWALIKGRLAENIWAEYEERLRKTSAEGDGDLRLRSLLQDRPSELVREILRGRLISNGITITQNVAFKEYIEDFQEFFADKAAARLGKEVPPRNIVDRFFDDVIETLRRLFGLNRKTFTGTSEDFIDSILRRPDNMNIWTHVRSASDTLADFAQANATTGDTGTIEKSKEADELLDKLHDKNLLAQLAYFYKKTLDRDLTLEDLEKFVGLAGLRYTDVIGAAFHDVLSESFEKIFSAKAQATIINAANSPTIKRQLRSLLAAYPQAWAEAQASPQAAAAYMFQFWMTGNIKLGPQTRGAFDSAANLLRGTLGIMSEQENANELFEALIRSDVILNYQNTGTRYVIKGITKNTVVKKVVHDYILPTMDKIHKANIFGNLFSTAQTRMMDTKNPYLIKIAESVDFIVGREGQKQPMIAERNRQIKRYTTIVYSIFKGKSKEHGQAVSKLLNSGAVIPPVSKATTEVERDAARLQRDVFKPMFEYFRGAGLSIGRIENYYPMVFDRDVIENYPYRLYNFLQAPNFKKPIQKLHDRLAKEYYNNVLEQIAPNDRGRLTDEQKAEMLKTAYELTDPIDYIVNSIVMNNGYADVSMSHIVVNKGLERSNPMMGAINERTLKWMTDVMSKEQRAEFGERFLSDDIGVTLTTYIEQGVKRAEYNRTFKKRSSTDEIIDYIPDLVDEDNYTKQELHELYELLIGPDYKEVFDEEKNTQKVKRDTGEDVSDYRHYRLMLTGARDELYTLYAKAIQNGATAQDLKLTQAYMDVVMGTAGEETNIRLAQLLGMNLPPKGQIINPKVQRGLGIAMVYQNIRLLALSAIPSLADPIGIMVRTGDIGMSFRAFKNGIHSIYKASKGDKDTLYSMAEMVGVIDQHMTVDALNWEYGGVYLVGRERRINEAFFRYNGLQLLTRTTRLMAAEAFRRFVKQHATRPDRNSKRYFSELNINIEDINYDSEGNVVFLSANKRAALERTMSDIANKTPEEIKEATDTFMADERMRSAMHSFVDTSILRPNATLRPVWASDPHFMLIFHLKSFMYAFHERVLTRLYVEAQNGNLAPLLMAAAFIPAMLMLGMLRDLIRFGEESPYKKDWGWGDYTSAAVTHAGLTGIGQIPLDVYDNISHGGMGVDPLIGPSLELISDIGVASVSDKKHFDAIKLLPANNIYRNWGD